MAKIGTAHIEIKPVLNRDALDAITEEIANAVADAVDAGIKRAEKDEKTSAAIRRALHGATSGSVRVS